MLFVISKTLNSFILRMAVLTAALFAVLVAALLGLAYWLMVKQPLESVRRDVQADVSQMIGIYGGAEDEATLISMLETYGDEKVSRPFFYLLLSSNNKIQAGNLPLDPSVFQNEGWSRVEFETGYSENSALVRKVGLIDGATLIAGRDIEDLDEREELITETLGWASVLALIVGLFGGIVISLAVTRRIETINTTALTVMNGKLDTRIPIKGSGDDFDNLSTTLNTMLDRIGELLGMVSSASNNIAHELRTPLARLMADIEDIESYSSETLVDPKLIQMIDRAKSQADRMRQIFDALLRISRIQSGRDDTHFEAIDMPALIQEAAGLYGPVAEQKNISLEVEKTASAISRVQGDANLLFQAVTNVLDNALKFTPSGGEVRIGLNEASGFLVVSVKDTGPGIPEDQKTRLGERFFQPHSSAALESASYENTDQVLPGNGLGLALVQAILDLHHGSMSFPESATGLSVRLELPRK